MAGYRVPVSIGLVLAAYAGWGALTARLISAVFGYSCSQSFLSVHCVLPDDVATPTPAYFGLLIFLALAAGILRFAGRHLAVYPFLMLSVVLCSCAVVWDIVAGQPILSAPKIINDTINVLGAVIASSLILLIILCRGERFMVGR